tara:strand:+ start:119 stop:997 length:879 start_codon:yes stop_codon:yes gene_type:complete
MIKERIKHFYEIFLKKIRQNVFLCFCVFLFLCAFLGEDFFIRGKSRAIFCDVGQGDGIFINLGKEQIVIDGGPDNKFIGCVGKYMPYFDRKIEYMIVSHPDKDHFVGAVEILRRYNVEKVIVNCDTSDIPEYAEFIKLAQNKLLCVKNTQSIELGDGSIEFLYPLDGALSKDANDNSLIFKFSYQTPSNSPLVKGEKKTILFTGDASTKVEKKLLKSGVDLKSDILKLGHHGSKTSSDEKFLQAVNPELAIVSVGADNKFGHPSYRVIKNLQKLGIKYYRTDEKEDIIVNFQ